MIRTNYDPEADILHVKFGPEGAKYDSSEEVAPGVYVDFDTAGNPIGVEISSVRWRSEDVRTARPADDERTAPAATA
jgi:uncharacterized protein YuzE